MLMQNIYTLWAQRCLPRYAANSYTRVLNKTTLLLNLFSFLFSQQLRTCLQRGVSPAPYYLCKPF